MVKIVFFAIQILFVGSACSQTSVTELHAAGNPHSDTMVVKARLEELFQYVRDNQIEKAASYIVYRGKDTARKWQDTYRYADAGERKEVEKICGWIKTFLDRAGKYDYQLFQIDKPWYAWNLSYQVNGNVPSVAFAFKQVNGKFCLGDIDEF